MGNHGRISKRRGWGPVKSKSRGKKRTTKGPSRIVFKTSFWTTALNILGGVGKIGKRAKEKLLDLGNNSELRPRKRDGVICLLI